MVLDFGDFGPHAAVIEIVNALKFNLRTKGLHDH